MLFFCSKKNISLICSLFYYYGNCQVRRLRVKSAMTNRGLFLTTKIRSKTLEKFSHSFGKNYGKTFHFLPYIFPKFSVCFFGKDLNLFKVINQVVTAIKKEKYQSLRTD
jgi:hypothetical protein